MITQGHSPSIFSLPVSSHDRDWIWQVFTFPASCAASDGRMIQVRPVGMKREMAGIFGGEIFLTSVKDKMHGWRAFLFAFFLLLPVWVTFEKVMPGALAAICDHCWNTEHETEKKPKSLGISLSHYTHWNGLLPHFMESGINHLLRFSHWAFYHFQPQACFIFKWFKDTNYLPSAHSVDMLSPSWLYPDFIWVSNLSLYPM